LSAAISRFLGLRLKLFRLEDLFLASLLQDIGILALENIQESPYLQFDTKALSHAERIEIEEKQLGVGHAYIGAWLLVSWELPDKIVDAVKFSHALGRSSSAEDKEDNYFHNCVNLSGSLADIWLEDTPAELV